jgi:GNAT superfamily N-acetyltransferase
MKPLPRLRRAVPGEGPAVARLIRASLPAHVRSLTIWASPHAGRYVEAVLSGRADRGAAFYLLELARRPAGVAAFRLLEGRGFLNHLYIEPASQGAGLGRRLLLTSLHDFLSGHRAREVALDVFAGNRRAEHWYARLGFTACAGCTWWVEQQFRPSGEPGAETSLRTPDPAWNFAGWRGNHMSPSWGGLQAAAGLQPGRRPKLSGIFEPGLKARRKLKLAPPRRSWLMLISRTSAVQGLGAARRSACATHGDWGFSSFRLRLAPGRCFTVGRLYTPYFRLTHPDPDLRRRLRAIDPKRRFLLIAAAPQPAPGWKRVAVTRRLICPAGRLLERLGSTPSS